MEIKKPDEWICGDCARTAPLGDWTVEMNTKGAVVSAVCPYCKGLGVNTLLLKESKTEKENG